MRFIKQGKYSPMRWMLGKETQEVNGLPSNWLCTEVLLSGWSRIRSVSPRRRTGFSAPDWGTLPAEEKWVAMRVIGFRVADVEREARSPKHSKSTP
jgi:hypothetical protein